MGKIFIDEPRVLSIETVECEEDLKPITGKMNLNPPPQNGRCDCCGRHISELKPFGGPGDPLVGDFTGAYLIKKFRIDCMNIEAYKIVQAFIREEENKVDYDHLLKVLIEKYGEEKGLYYLEEGTYDVVSASWECRDCACLDALGYYEKNREAERNGMFGNFWRDENESDPGKQMDGELSMAEKGGKNGR